MFALPGCDACEETPTGPSNLAVVRIDGPSEVQVGARAQFRAFARPLGGNTYVEVTTTVRWLTVPAGRLTLAADGSATGVSEGQTFVTAILEVSNVDSSMSVNVIGAPVADTVPTTPLPPPTSPTPPPAQGELAVACPATIEIDSLGSCTASHTVDRVPTSVTSTATWTSTDDLIVQVDGSIIRGFNVGTAFVSATYQSLTARAQVRVVYYVDGQYNAVFTPRSNTCDFSVRPVRTGIMTIAYREGTLEIGGSTQAYSFTYVITNSVATRIEGLSSANGFSYSMTLQEGERGRITGEENIQAPQGCGATYDVVLERR